MALPSLLRRTRGARSVPARREEHPFLGFQRDLNRLLEDFWRGFYLPVPFEEWGDFTPRVDMDETDGEVRITAELPGLTEKDFEVSLAGDAVVLKGEKREEREDRAQGWKERSYGSFERVIGLPCEVDTDRVSAEFKHGVLRVTLPKSARAREQTKRIPITTA